MQAESIAEPLRALSRAGLPIGRTPLHRLRRLSCKTGREIWIKRDDWGDFALSGSKARKLDYILPRILAAGYKRVIGSGPANSNSCRALAAACSMLGLKCDLFLWGDSPVELRGNAALAGRLGAAIHWQGHASWTEKEVRAQEFARQTGAYYLKPGGTEPEGVLGIAVACLELFEQCKENGICPAAIVHASATGGLSAGIRIGVEIARSSFPTFSPHVLSVAVLDDVYEGELQRAYEAITETAMSYAGLERAAEFELHLEFMEGGYGFIGACSTAAREIFGFEEGVLLDDVYMAKAAAALLELAPRYDGPIILWHSGGSQAIGG